MEIIAFATRSDEKAGFDKFSKELNIKVKNINERLTLETVHEARGFKFVSVLGNCDVNSEVLEKLNEFGVEYIASRSAGYNNIDIKKAKELGIGISNANYSPKCVADFAVMLMLMCIRKVVWGLERARVNDYSVIGLQGKEMHNLVVGVIGTGKIGQAVIKNLSGFGCKILAYDIYENESMKKYVQYVDMDTLYKECDIITIHSPLFDSNYNLINKESMRKMKDGVVIINTSRGELINTRDLIEALDKGKVGAVGLDVLENEVGIFHSDCRFTGVNNKDIIMLKQMKNVILTHHFAFYTDQAVYDMVGCALKSLRAFHDKIKNPYIINC